MPIMPVAFSLMASFMSAITLLGVSSENYTFGFQFIVINISYGIFTPVAAYLYLPVFFRLQATSAYEVCHYEYIFNVIKISSFILVLRKTFWPNSEASSFFGIYHADGILYGGGFICSCVSSRGYYRH